MKNGFYKIAGIGSLPFQCLGGVMLFMGLCAKPVEPPSSQSPVELLFSAKAIVIEWSPPSLNGKPFPVVSYKLYYRNHDQAPWEFLSLVPANSTPACTLQFDTLKGGNYDFAITSVDSSGEESVFHSSLDQNAEPAGGWYLTWNTPTK
jgi:hypothetical protein